MEKRCIVLGGGLGGLFCAALLGKQGHRVLVLEKNRVVGGGLQCFRRGDALFPTGMHVFGGFQPGGQLHRICSYLGILDQLSLLPTDADSFDEIIDLHDGKHYRLPQGKEAYVEYWAARFPEEREHIRAYVEAMYRLTEEEDLFYLREPGVAPVSHSEAFSMPVDRFVARYIRDKRLRSLLSYMAPLYAGVAGETPAYVHALVNVSHINGSCSFAGESQQLADCLVRLIRRQGGEVLTGEEVTRIRVEQREVTGVETRSGKFFTAANYVSDLPPDVLLRLADKGAFPPSFCHRIREIPSTYSAFKVYIRFKPGCHPHVNHPCYAFTSPTMWVERNFGTGGEKLPEGLSAGLPEGLSEKLPEGLSEGLSEKLSENKSGSKTGTGTGIIPGTEPWPQRLVYMTQPETAGTSGATAGNNRFAQTMVVILPMPFDWVRPWENSRVGDRGADYARWKATQTERVLSFMEEKIDPDLRAHIAAVYASSPLTIRDYLGNQEGGMYGFHKQSDRLELSRLAVQTKVKHLFLTGQHVNLHGMCGVALTAVATACALLQRTDLIAEIAREP